MPLGGTRRHRPSLRDARVRVQFHEDSVTALSRQDPTSSTPLLVAPDQREDSSRCYPCVTQKKKAQPVKSIEPYVYWSG